MSNIIYKTLVEVQLLHEYYLTNSDGTTVFDSGVNKLDFLMDRFGKGIPSIGESLQYDVPVALQNFFKNYHLHVVANYAGFSILIRVVENKLADGTTVYEPFVKLPVDCNLLIQLSLKNNLLSAITNARINTALPAVYYFSNEIINSKKTFPLLPERISAQNDAYAYEQGELYLDKKNNICQFYLNGTKRDFLPVQGLGFANANDQLLVPLQFVYKFNAADNVTKARFQLKNSKGKTVRSYEFNTDHSLQQVLINFNNNQSPKLLPLPQNILTLPQSVGTVQNLYTLNITLNGKKIIVYKIMFYERDNSLGACWGVVNIKPTVSNPDFNLFEDDGTIKYKKLPNGNIVAAPVFEVPIKSRIIYWRYINDLLVKLKAGASNDFLDKEGNNLVSKIPRPTSYLPTLFKDDSSKLHYLPNPVSDESMTIEGQKIYTNIYVAKSKMFPVDTS